MQRPHLTPTRSGVALTGILAVGAALRLWGVRNGLPEVYNVDELQHFVPPAVGFFAGSFNPHYFGNPPAYTYLLNVVYAFYYGGFWPFGAGASVTRAYATNRDELFLIGRVVSGLLGIAAAGVLYAVGKRLWGSAAGLIAAALVSFSFIPVFYGHYALNDSPTLLPVSLALLGSVGIAQTGRARYYLLAGSMVGLATATKYLALAVVVSVVVAFAVRTFRDRAAFRRELPLLFLAGALSVVAFVIANPYSVISMHEFTRSLRRQQYLAANVAKLGTDDRSGWVYYLWTATWGFGWAPLAATAAGIWFAIRARWQLAVVLLSYLIAFWFVVGDQTRFYARWLLPAYPVLALFAAYGVVRLAQLVAPRLRAGALVALSAALLAQPLWTSVRNDRVLAGTDTRATAGAWLRANLPAGRKVVIEGVGTNGMLSSTPSPFGPPAWETFPLKTNLPEAYESTLSPALIDEYQAGQYCTVIVGSLQRGRGEKDPSAVPNAMAYYARLDQEARVVAHFSPVRDGAKLPTFNFDWSTDYYPAVYERPGPDVKIYQLSGGACAQLPAPA